MHERAEFWEGNLEKKSLWFAAAFNHPQGSNQDFFFNLKPVIFTLSFIQHVSLFYLFLSFFLPSRLQNVDYSKNTFIFASFGSPINRLQKRKGKHRSRENQLSYMFPPYKWPAKGKASLLPIFCLLFQEDWGRGRGVMQENATYWMLQIHVHGRCHRQTDMQIDRWTNRQTDRRTDKETER